MRLCDVAKAFVGATVRIVHVFRMMFSLGILHGLEGKLTMRLELTMRDR